MVGKKHKVVLKPRPQLASTKIKNFVVKGGRHVFQWDSAKNELILAVLGPVGEIYADIQDAFTVCIDEKGVVLPSPPLRSCATSPTRLSTSS